jgi:hypothetical protein
MRKKASFQLSVNFIVIIIICLVIFIFSMFFIRRFFSHAEDLKLIWDERTESEIERILDDGSRVAIPFDKKTIVAGEYNKFGIGILNVLDKWDKRTFRVTINFNKAYDKQNNLICATLSECGPPDTWLQTTDGYGVAGIGIQIEKDIPTFQQSKFLLGITPKEAGSGIYIFDLGVTFHNGTDWQSYDNLHKLYVEVP